MATKRSPRTRSSRTRARKDVCVELASELRMNIAPGLRGELLAAQEAGALIEIDGSSVASADTAALQVLYVFASDNRGRDIAWRWKGVSDSLRDACRLLGIESELDLPAAPAV